MRILTSDSGLSWKPILPVAPDWMVQCVVAPVRGVAVLVDVAMGWPVIHRWRVSDAQVWIIAEKEVAENVRNFKIPAAFSLLAALILVSFFLMSLDYQKRLDNWSTNRAAQSDQLFSGVTENYRSADNQMSMSAQSIRPESLLRKPVALSVVAKGLDSVMERSAIVGEHETVPPATSFTLGAAQERNRNLMLTAPPDFFYIIKIILSLLALFFTYDSLAGEKEMGTLRAILSGPVRRRSVLAGKWIGAALSLTVPFLLASITGLLFLTLARGVRFDPTEWVRMLLVIAASVLYSLVFISAGLLISARSSTRKQSIAVALSVWVALALALPNVTALVASRLRPVPTLNDHNTRAIPLARQIEDEFKDKEEGFLFPGYGIHYSGAASRIRHLVRRFDDDYIARTLDRDRLARRLARLSPAGAFSYAVTDLAGTGLAEFQSYIAKLQRARDRQIQLADEKETTISINMTDEESRKKADEELKRFFEKSKQMRNELYESLVVQRSPAEAINDALADVAILAAWCALTFAAAMMVFNRADVR